MKRCEKINEGGRIKIGFFLLRYTSNEEAEEKFTRRVARRGSKRFETP